MFLSQQHKELFQVLLERDNTYSGDIERQVLFFIFAGSRDLYGKVNAFYDFEEGLIRPEGFGEVDLIPSEKGLVELAFNLHNNYRHEEQAMLSIVELFTNLDQGNFKLAIAAIRVRFDKSMRDFIQRLMVD